MYPLQSKESEWITIKLRDYLRLHPNQGVELLTEFGYYTLTKQEIKTQLRKHGAVRSVTGRPLSFDTLLEQEVLDEQPGDPPLLRTGRKERRTSHADLSKIRSLYEDAVPHLGAASFYFLTIRQDLFRTAPWGR